MDNVAQKELLEFLNNAIQVETDVATQEKIAAEYEKTMAERKPRLIIQQEPKIPTNEIRGEGNIKSEGDAKSCIALFGVPSLISLFLGFIVGSGVILGIGAICLACALSFVYILSKHKSDYSTSHELYIQQKAIVQRKNVENQKAYEASNNEWKASYRKSKAVLDEHLSQTKAILAKLYNRNVIYPKYCTLPALTSIYEYFMTGRCTELTGPDGAYNMYENEVRKDTVIAKLNTVIENLEKIRQNQYMLYQQVKVIQERTDTIAANLHQIKGYTVQIAQLSALNAYYAALNERNTRITMYYHL